MSCVEGITSLLEAGKNCQDGNEIRHAHAAMKRLRSRAQWGTDERLKGAVQKNDKVMTETDGISSNADIVAKDISASAIHLNKRIKFTLKVEK